MCNSSLSDIRSFYGNKTVLLTGVTGFLGKVLLEKLLRSCGDLKTIYVLIRDKGGKSFDLRLEEVFASEVFDGLKEERRDFQEMVKAIRGDCSQDSFGLSDADEETVLEEVDCIFHLANAKINDPRETAAKVNARSVRDLISMTKRCKRLKGLVYVSSAYSNYERYAIEEKIYKVPSGGEEYQEQGYEKINFLSKHHLEKNLPNVFFKSVAENLIQNERLQFPVVIVRPSLILNAWRQPKEGWCECTDGPNGIIQGIYLGLIHTLNVNPKYLIDIVPVDYTANFIIAAAAKAQEVNEKIIYNYVSCSPLTWGDYLNYTRKYGRIFVSKLQIWHSFTRFTPNGTTYFTALFLFHILPALITDGVACLFGKRPGMLRTYYRIHRYLSRMSFLMKREWRFTNDNSLALWESLSEEDRSMFAFDVWNVNREEYFYSYMKGCRLYLLKDPLSSIPLAIMKERKLVLTHWILILLLFAIFFKIFQIFLA